MLTALGDPAAMARARIPVERIAGPVLLLSGGEVTWSMVLPTTPSLAGVDVLWQAVVLSGVSLQLTGCLPDRLVP